MPSSGRKRSAPDASSGPPTQPPNLRVLRLPAEPLSSDLAANLACLSKEQLLEMVVSLASVHPSIQTAAEGIARTLAAAEAENQRQAERRQAKAAQQARDKVPDFTNFMTRVEKYMDKEPPFSWGASRLMSEAARVTYGIEKILDQILQRCPRDSSFPVRATGMEVMVHIWHIVIFATPSYTRKQCINDSYMWPKKFLEMWSRFTSAEISCLGRTTIFVNTLNETANEWVRHCAHIPMFKEVLGDLKENAEGATSPGSTQGSQSPPASDPPSETVDLTGE
ncbi:hypothetical protein HJFPF1_10594 [Paramyrothecium foliicola]|nr:hypothetical protein HJFPF1_10594 [Paramyrothecium foliicola]